MTQGQLSQEFDRRPQPTLAFQQARLVPDSPEATSDTTKL
jgi:hypothetical protein